MHRRIVFKPTPNETYYGGKCVFLCLGSSPAALSAPLSLLDPEYVSIFRVIELILSCVGANRFTQQGGWPE